MKAPCVRYSVYASIALVGAPHVRVLHEGDGVVLRRRHGRPGRRGAPGRHRRHVVPRAPGRAPQPSVIASFISTHHTTQQTMVLILF